NNTKPLLASTCANQGTLGIIHANGDTTALFAADLPVEVPSGNGLLTKAADTALFAVQEEESEELLVRGQIYTNTSLWLETVATPRFQVSSQDHIVHINLEQGRLRLTAADSDRGIDLLVKLPQGEVRLNAAGEYSFDVQDDTAQVSVLTGSAVVYSVDNPNDLLPLVDDERSILRMDASPTGPFPAERNLISNGSFREELNSGWTVFDWDIDDENQPGGSTELVMVDGEEAIRFSRFGSGHAEASIRQVINRDVTDFNELVLVVGVQINQQSLGVCGSVGSECPLTVRLTYDDTNGQPHTLEQGFFATGEIDNNLSPEVCIYCAPPHFPHKRVQPNRLFIEEIDILQSLATAAAVPPSRLHSITIIAAGHSFETDLFEVGIRARE
ncbi:MAG: hypothetical protein AAF633_18675, partial [Chloroflexota bacterium]